jgi:hypothetical protein
LKVDGFTIVARREAPEVLHSVETTLDAVVIYLGEFVVWDDDLAQAVLTG